MGFNLCRVKKKKKSYVEIIIMHPHDCIERYLKYWTVVIL